MRPTTRLFTRARANTPFTFKTPKPQVQSQSRILTTTTTTKSTPKTAVNMSAPGIPSSTPLQQQSASQAQDPTQPPSQAQGLTQKSGVNTATGPVAGSTASGNGAGPTSTGAGGSGARGIGEGLGGDDASSYGITSTDLKTAAGVELSPRQRVLVGGVLDLFKGLPTHKKMSLWTDDATFADPLTKAQGRKQYEAQWWGLKAAFSEIEQQHHSITSSGNPITLDLKTRYKVKGIGAEKVIESVIKIHTDEKGERVTGVEDRWNGNIPEGAIATALRNLNSVVVPAFVSVPKDDGEKK
ncbi:hypothetical protein DL98DRAFT_516811 [Cadophora sp. DSE1049]|nr:hypothetical protein DL98DRAFT_516811 [Cadophora sp. DSE1049]